MITEELVKVGLATRVGEHSYTRFDPALTAYLSLILSTEQRGLYRQRWNEAMAQLVDLLCYQQNQNDKFSAQLTQQELPNLLVYLHKLVIAWQTGKLANWQTGCGCSF